jgi:hypothetical protein
MCETRSPSERQKWELTRGYDLVRDDSMQLPPLHLNHEGRQTMRKLLLSTAAAIMLAGPALAQTKSVTGTLSGPIKGGPGEAPSTIVLGLGVNFIAIGNRVDVLNVGGNALFPTCTVTVPLATITDMVFTPPFFLTVQGGGPFAVTISYMGGCPPVVRPPVPL